MKFEYNVFEPLNYLKQRVSEDWLIGYDSNQFNYLVKEFLGKFTQLSLEGIPPKILLAESDPWRFLAAFIAAVAADCPVFLGNSNWVEREWEEVIDLVKPNLVLGKGIDLGITEARNLCYGIGEDTITNNQQLITNNQQSRIMIPTGGSSGKIRFAIHSWDTLMASVSGFHQYFDCKPINSFCVLPLHHVSGLMQFIRSLTTGGRFAILPFKALIAGEGRDINPSEFFISLVPTQLQKLLNAGAAEWLSRFQTVLLGGAAPWESLLEEARSYSIRLAPTYGMTETASQIVTLKPEAFLAGNNSSGQILPHAKVTICSNTGEILGVNETGIVTIEADSLAVGYYPVEVKDKDNFSSHQSHITENNIKPTFQIPNLQSDDLGFFDSEGYLTIVSRRSHKIITGGENVFPAEVEAAILASQLVTDVCVVGLADSYWGEVVTAVYAPNSPQVSSDLLQETITDKLCKFKHPKYWIPVEVLPRNSQGKINYQEIKQVALACLSKL
ncbi:2-succinylbenzoate--CoA ligase [Limnofasciculus baicalensis]|uniref:2-succinylbenzoate--CoA ligase n=1 Tax=Limnofasciculus baicalensis BBK-W-15 TaxID=2699891 RepID=A0AAE3GNC7_9CYAN|nr:2-succinylbenzoate--CoA ligase [Limnofasciculus baicalensis]MCP2727062.1 2-succinylbenzoate--CoA ligase [Limnofasciculus baicalensis BBK-W-15]